MEKQDYSKTIKIAFFGVAIAVLLLALGFQFWIIRSQGYEITTLRNENMANRADAEDMRRKLIALTNDSPLIPLENEFTKTQRKSYYSESFTGHYNGDLDDFLRLLEVDDKRFVSPEHQKALYSKKIGTVIYADDLILSYCLLFDSYPGGAHELYDCYMGTIVRSPDGKIPSKYLSLSDIVSEDQLPELKWRLRQSFIDELIRRNDMHRFDDNNEFVGVPPEPTENFYYDDKGLHFFYNPYDIGSFAEGTFDLCIEWPLPKSATWTSTPAGETDEEDLPELEKSDSDR